MVFWGVEVKPGESFTPADDGAYEGSRLHLSQATLGLECKGKQRTVVKCKVGDGPELLLCSLTPGASESFSLDLLFDHDVVFSVAGPTSVHLVGYYIPLDDEEEDDDYEFDGSEFDSEDDMEDKDYEDDSEMEDIDVHRSSVNITELDEDGDLLIAKGILVKNKQASPDSDEEKSMKKRRRVVVKKETQEKTLSSKEVEEVVFEEASEDEDGFPVSLDKTKAVNGSEEISTPSTASKESKKDKKKKSKKNKKAKKDQKEEATVQIEGGEKTPIRAAEKTPIKAAEKTPVKVAKENGSEAKTPAKVQSANGSTVTPGTDATAKKLKKFSVRKFPNGLEIEEVAMGKPDARQCKAGKKVSVHYTGKLKSGKIFDSSVGKKPFVFRLGVGEVVRGWDVGVAGMRIGDKRRITVPPAMGYGAKGTGPIPGNSTLIFDVEVVDVGK